MATRTKVKPTPKINLPKYVIAADFKYPKFDPKRPYWNRGDVPYSIILHRVGGEHARTERGWCIATLFISKGKAGQPDRTYAIGIDDEKIVTVGNGPHVAETITVHIHEGNAERLKPLIDLWRKGMAEAGEIRDRISSRRAQGQLHRAAGRTSWMW